MRFITLISVIFLAAAGIVSLHACSQKDMDAVRQGHSAATQAVAAVEGAVQALPPGPTKDSLLDKINTIETYLGAVGVLLGAVAVFQRNAKKALQQDFDAVVESVEVAMPSRSEDLKADLAAAQGPKVTRRVHEAKGRLGL